MEFGLNEISIDICTVKWEESMRHVGIAMLAVMALITAHIPPADARDKSEVLKASTVVGMKVQSTEGKRLGDIKDLVIDPADGSIGYAVLDFGGFLGIGDKYFAVPWEALQWTPDHKAIVLDVSKKDLKQAPGFDKNNWPDLGSEEQALIIYEYYGMPLPGETPTPSKVRK
jgi:sporulation protein YlmC with PRC-barrel domain